MSSLPGTIAKHVIVSDECRTNRGDMAAAREAVARILHEYGFCEGAWKDKGARFHFVLTLEKSDAL